MSRLATTTRVPTDVLTIASVPANHVYVRHVAAEAPDGVRRLPDPDPDPDAPQRSATERWWPPVMLDPRWVRANAFDVFHVQFGFDAWDPRHLREVVDAAHATGRPFVYTAHDLRNPHHAEPGLHDEQLAVLMDAADAVVTLTPGAAAEIQQRWGREASVLPHPHVVDLPTMHRMARRRRRSGGFRVGLHVKSLRASMDPLALLPTLVDTVRALPGAVLQVNGHRDVLDPAGERYDAPLAEALRAAERRGEIELHVHDFLSDAELWDYLASLDLSVLPYRFGTHSGWLEACRDLGTAVAAPTCGYYADQGPVHSFVLDEEHFDEASLARALLDAYAAGPVVPLGVAERRAQRQMIADAHRELYRSLT